MSESEPCLAQVGRVLHDLTEFNGIVHLCARREPSLISLVVLLVKANHEQALLVRVVHKEVASLEAENPRNLIVACLHALLQSIELQVLWNEVPKVCPDSLALLSKNRVVENGNFSEQ